MNVVHKFGTVILGMAVLVATVGAQTPIPTYKPGSSPQAASPDFNSPRPIEAVDSVMMNEMTWMEVRDAMKAGKTTVIIATGGLEQNGPYLVTDKHNIVLRATTEAIARKLGNALVGTIVPYVPEGEIDPPTGHMRYPSTVTVTDATFKALLTDIASSYRQHGFAHLILIGDSGGNQKGMKEVAETLSVKWGGKPTIHYIPEYYNYDETKDWVAANLGIKEVDEGLHDDFEISSSMMTVDPNSVRLPQRIKAGKATINGVPLAPADQAIAIGRKIVDFRATQTVKAIQKALGTRPSE